MQKSTSTIVGIATIVIVCVAVLLFSARPDSPLQTTLTPSADQGPGHATAGDVYAMVIATHVTDFAGAQFDVTFDPAVVAFEETEEGSLLDGGDSEAAMILETAQATSGRVSNVVVLRIKQPGVDGTGTVAVLQFKRIGAGSPAFALENVLLSDSKGQSIDSDSLSVLIE